MPQDFASALRGSPGGIGPTLELPQRVQFPTMAGASLARVPTASEEALQAPDVDPVNAIAFGAPGSLSGLFGRLLMNTALEMGIGGGGGLYDRVQRNKALEHGDFPAEPAGYMEGYYKPEMYTSEPRRMIPNFTPTAPLFREGEQHRTQELYPFDRRDMLMKKTYEEALPDYVSLPSTVIEKFGKVSGKSLPDPRDLLWHSPVIDAASTMDKRKADYGGEASYSAQRLRDMQESYGIHGGYFAEKPNAFGPFHLGVRPADLPQPLEMSRPQLREDPWPEIIPSWTDALRNEDKLTVSGRSLPKVSVHPSKVMVIDSEGNLLGSLAKQRPESMTAKATTELAPAAKNWFKYLLERMPK